MTNNPPSSRIQPGEYGFPLKLKPRYDNFIGGDWVAPVGGEYYSNLTPVTGQPLCEIASSGKRDIDLALDAAHRAKDKWGQTSVQDRAAMLFKIADRMEQNLELLATAETWDNGKPIRETMAADVPPEVVEAITSDAIFPRRFGEPEDFVDFCLAITRNPMLNDEVSGWMQGEAQGPLDGPAASTLASC